MAKKVNLSPTRPRPNAEATVPSGLPAREEGCTQNTPPVPESTATKRIDAAANELAEAVQNHGCLMFVITDADTGGMRVAISKQRPLMNGSLLADAVLRFPDAEADGSSVGAAFYTAIITSLALLIENERTPFTEEKILADLAAARGNINRTKNQETKDESCKK